MNMLKALMRSVVRDHVRCSFCGKGPEVGRRFVSGPGVYICSECVEVAARVLAEDAEAAPPE
jgi:ATP-dependent Clp protease ATP-binding subunit ClpX